MGRIWSLFRRFAEGRQGKAQWCKNAKLTEETLTAAEMLERLRFLEAKAKQAYGRMYEARIGADLAACYTTPRNSSTTRLRWRDGWGCPATPRACPPGSRRSRASFADSSLLKRRSEPLQHAALPSLRHSKP